MTQHQAINEAITFDEEKRREAITAVNLGLCFDDAFSADLDFLDRDCEIMEETK